MIGEILCEGEIVGAEHDNSPFVLDSKQQCVQRPPGRWIETGNRFVEDQHLERPKQPTGKLGLLTHTARQLTRKQVSPLLETEEVEQHLRTLLQILHSVCQPNQIEMVDDREIRIQRRGIGNERDHGSHHARSSAAVNIVTGDVDGSTGRFDAPGKHGERRGLARPVVTNEGNRLPGSKIQIERLERVYFPVLAV